MCQRNSILGYIYLSKNIHTKLMAKTSQSAILTLYLFCMDNFKQKLINLNFKLISIIFNIHLGVKVFKNFKIQFFS